MPAKPAEIDAYVHTVAVALATSRHGWHPAPDAKDLRDARIVVEALERLYDRQPR